MVSRRGFDAQFRWTQDEWGSITSADRCLQLHALTFDASVHEVFWTLLVGGVLVLPCPGRELETPYLDRLIEDSGTTVVQAVWARKHGLTEIEAMLREHGAA